MGMRTTGSARCPGKITARLAARVTAMKIYYIKAQAPLRVLALAKLLGIKAEYVEADLMAGDLKAPEYAEINPNRKVPTLVDADLVLWEASAIMAYLCIKTGSDMWPAHNPANKSRCCVGYLGAIVIGRPRLRRSILSTWSSRPSEWDRRIPNCSSLKLRNS